MQLIESRRNESADKYIVKQDFQYAGDDYWDWSIWVEAEPEYLDAIDHVIYNLHYTFPEPVQIRRDPQDNFRLRTSGWGIFTIYIKIMFKDQSILDLEHELVLEYPEGYEGLDVFSE